MPPLFYHRLLKNSFNRWDFFFSVTYAWIGVLFSRMLWREVPRATTKGVYFSWLKGLEGNTSLPLRCRSGLNLALHFALQFLHRVQIAQHHMTFLLAGPLDWLSIFSRTLHICQKVSILKTYWVMPSLKMWLQEVINENFQDKKVLKECVLDIFSVNIHSPLTLTTWEDSPWDFSNGTRNPQHGNYGSRVMCCCGLNTNYPSMGSCVWQLVPNSWQVWECCETYRMGSFTEKSWSPVIGLWWL